ncbi:hypothetical protein PCH_Pc16g04180 [Penicillium rubens Wisconsin 54-1255]|uniref:Uncharacterized protein n=1 Tax=Penicillium rubens (strain ATCC 28089 / DSM 1075 / NRRL 1951 / Wisconsin 54-1255) TaxID=500485 RepID=B6H8F0_PENRW|nr:hypothetical protein PCH_Pc16g04180 [Penicillium rubens Wisconsin 54-1255]
MSTVWSYSWKLRTVATGAENAGLDAPRPQALGSAYPEMVKGYKVLKQLSWFPGRGCNRTRQGMEFTAALHTDRRMTADSCIAVDTVTGRPRAPWHAWRTPFVGMQLRNPCSSKPDFFDRALQHATVPATHIWSNHLGRAGRELPFMHAWDMEPDREHGNVSPEKLYGGETTAAAASSFGKGVRCSRGYGYSFVPATLEQQHSADVIGGSSGLGDGHILPDWGSLGRERMFSPMVLRKATRPVRTACKGATLHPAHESREEVMFECRLLNIVTID